MLKKDHKIQLYWSVIADSKIACSPKSKNYAPIAQLGKFVRFGIVKGFLATHFSAVYYLQFYVKSASIVTVKIGN